MQTSDYLKKIIGLNERSAVCRAHFGVALTSIFSALAIMSAGALFSIDDRIALYVAAFLYFGYLVASSVVKGATVKTEFDALQEEQAKFVIEKLSEVAEQMSIKDQHKQALDQSGKDMMN